MKRNNKILYEQIMRSVSKEVKRILNENTEDTVLAEVHLYDCKGRQFELNYLRMDLNKMGIETTGTGFNDDYDGFVDVKITFEQAKLLDQQYGNKLYIIGEGRGRTIEERFNNALRINKMFK